MGNITFLYHDSYGGCDSYGICDLI